MIELKNTTPFTADIIMLPNDLGVDCLYTIAKASFEFKSGLNLCSEQPSIVASDEYIGEGLTATMTQASDYTPLKPSTDIVVVGSAFAPNARPCQSCMVQVRVGVKSLTLKITGDRVWNKGFASQADTFLKMPIEYQRAFGGVVFDEAGSVRLFEQNNPAGCGLSKGLSAMELEGHSLPNIEDPARTVSTMGDDSLPVGLGFVPPAWHSRAKYLGTYDEHWQEQRAPFLPSDFDRRFFNCANPALVYDGYLQGGEAISISNMHPDGDWCCSVPAVDLRQRTEFRGSIEQQALNLELMLLEPEKGKMTLTWKSELPVDKYLLEVGKVELALKHASQELAPC